MRPLRSVTFTERLRIGYGRMQAPVTYSLSGRRFLRTEEAFGRGALDVHSLGRRNQLTEFAFAVPPVIPGSTFTWYRIWVGRHYRLRRELIVGEEGRVVRSFR